MRSKGQILMLIFAFLIISTSALSFTNYTETGRSDGNFYGDNTIFNSEYANVYTAPDPQSAPLSDGRLVPLVADLDNDGINEIIVLDSSTISIFHDKQINNVAGYSIGNTGYISNMVVFDVDNDSRQELIFARGTNKDVVMLNYNSSGLVNKTSFGITTGFTYTDGEIAIKCGKKQECMAIISSRIQGTLATATLIAVPFNTSGFVASGSAKQLLASATHVFCFPRIKDIVYADVNGITGSATAPDGAGDYIFSAIDYSISGGGNEQPQIFVIGVNSSFGARLERQITPSSIGFDIADGGTNLCSSTFGAGKYISSPLVMDAVPNGAGLLEIIFGEATATNTFKMRVYEYSSTGTSLRDHPFGNADGQIVSNPMKMNAFFADKSAVSDKQNDYCIMGYVASTQYLDLVCGSMINDYGAIPFVKNSVQYFSNYENFNVTNTYDTYNIMTHSVRAEGTQINNNNADEIINSYGIFKFSEDDCDVTNCVLLGCATLNQCMMDNIFENGVFDSVVVPVDAFFEDSDDYLALTTSNIYYIDDKFQNSPPDICRCPSDSCEGVIDCSVSPCDNAVWKTNITANVLITARDDDNDKVSYRIVAYAGTDNEYDTGFGANFSSGTSQTLHFVANKSVSGGILRLYATDNNDPTGHIVQNEDFIFNVASDGVETSFCTSTIAGTGTTTTEEETGIGTGNQTLTPNEDNPIVEGLGVINSYLGIGLIGIWLLIMIGVNVYMVYYGKEIFRGIDAKFMFAIMSVVNVMLLILGALLLIIPFWLILLMILAFVGIFVLWIAQKVGGGQ